MWFEPTSVSTMTPYLSDMYERAMELNRRLSEGQKVRGGATLMLVGAAIVTVLAFGPIASIFLEGVLGLVGVALLVVGTLAVGISEFSGNDGERAV